MIAGMVTFDEAKRAVFPIATRTWHKGMGTLVMAPKGAESPKWWRVRAVAQEELDGDRSFIQMDETIYLVNKQTGEVEITAYLVDPDRIDKMTPYPA